MTAVEVATAFPSPAASPTGPPTAASSPAPLVVVDMVALIDANAVAVALPECDSNADPDPIIDAEYVIPAVAETALDDGDAPKESVAVGVQVGVGVGDGVDVRVAVSVKRAEALFRSLEDSVGGRDASACAVGSAVTVASSLAAACSLPIADGVDGALSSAL
jgi:hypothetical protein